MKTKTLKKGCSNQSPTLSDFTTEQLVAELNSRHVKKTEDQIEADKRSDQYKKALDNSRYYFTKGSYTNEQTYGIWRIYGEDSNCDMGGAHKQSLSAKCCRHPRKSHLTRNET